MEASSLHRFEQGGRRFVLDTETCFCFECDEVSWAVMELYPHTPVNHILHQLGPKHPVKELEEVIGELEWLRSTKSILPVTPPKERLKQFELLPELRAVEILLPDRLTAGGDSLVSGGVALLLGRSGARKKILLRLSFQQPPHSVDELDALIRRTRRDARLAGKDLTIEVSLPLTSIRELEGHQATVILALGDAEDPRSSLNAFFSGAGGRLSRLSTIPEREAGTAISVQLVPGRADFSGCIPWLNSQGIKQIDLDLPAAYTRHPNLQPADLLAGMQTAAVHYAEQLLQGNFFRLEPIASTFRQIYEGTAQPRSDESGTQRLAVDRDGAIYPSRYFIGNPTFCLGNVENGDLDEAVRAPFHDHGIHTTAPCIRCWARNLCGGGHSAINAATGAGIREPSQEWCDRQRDWFAAAVAAFNLLSSHGVNFARLYQNLQPRKKPSLWQAARTAMTMKVGVRPIEEADATLLTQWENWSSAAYFLGNEYGMFLATCYDREMDSLHPRGIEQELMIVSKRNEPLGLLKLRPEPKTSISRVWFFLADPAGYGESGLRKSFGHILKEAAGQAPFSTLITAVGPGDPGLAGFLEALGFNHIGSERAALFVHDAYHDLEIYALRMT